MYGIIVLGQWMSGFTPKGEVILSDWLTDAMCFISEQEAKTYAERNLSHLDRATVMVVSIRRR